MKISNYGTLKTAIADFMERGDLTTVLAYFVDYAHQEICRNLRANVNTVAADISISASSITAPTDFQAARRLYLSTTPVRTIAFCSPETLAEVSAEYSTATWPTHCSVQGNQLVFAPTVGATYTGKLLYWASPTTLVNDSDTNAVLTEYPFLYLYGSLVQACRYLLDDRRVEYEQLFAGLLNDINKSEAFDALAGGIQGRPSTGII